MRAIAAALAFAVVACGQPAARRVEGASASASAAGPVRPLPPAEVSADAAAVDGADASSPAAPETAALSGAPLETWRVDDLEVVLALPLGAREPRPVVVGVHGSHDRPDATCRRWSRALAGFPIVVCPRGVPYRGGLAWGSPTDLALRIDRALVALRERHRALVADGTVLYAGWSLGATLGPKVVAARPGVFDPVVLAEVGHTRIDAKASAASLRAARVTRTLVACATRKCAAFAKRLGPNAVFVDAGIGRGHVFDARTARAVGSAVQDSVARDPRWSGLAAAIAASPADAGFDDEALPSADEEPDLAPDP